MDGMPSEPTIRKLMASRPDFPVLRRGGFGHTYLLDLDRAAAFVFEHWSDGRCKPHPLAGLVDLPLFKPR